jgi:hypothetical protein
MCVSYIKYQFPLYHRVVIIVFHHPHKDKRFPIGWATTECFNLTSQTQQKITM